LLLHRIPNMREIYSEKREICRDFSARSEHGCGGADTKFGYANLLLTTREARGTTSRNVSLIYSAYALGA
jgi:hypothetical protein